MTIIKKERTAKIVSTSRFEDFEFLIIKDKRGKFSGTVRRRGEESSDEENERNEESFENQREKILEEARISARKESATEQEEEKTSKIKKKAAIEEKEAAEESIENEKIKEKTNNFSNRAKNLAGNSLRVGRNVALAGAGFAGAAGSAVVNYAEKAKTNFGNELAFFMFIIVLKVLSLLYYGLGNVIASLGVMGSTLAVGFLFGFFTKENLEDNKLIFFLVVIDGILPLLLSFKIFYQSQAAYVANNLFFMFTIIPWSAFVILLTMKLENHKVLAFFRGAVVFAVILVSIILLFQIKAINEGAQKIKQNINSQVDTDLAAVYAKQAALDAKEFGKNTYEFMFGGGLGKAIRDWNKGLVSYAVPGYDNTEESEAPKTGLWIEQSSVGQSLLFSQPRDAGKGQTIDVGARINILTVIPADLKISCYSKKIGRASSLVSEKTQKIYPKDSFEKIQNDAKDITCKALLDQGAHELTIKASAENVVTEVTLPVYFIPKTLEDQISSDAAKKGERKEVAMRKEFSGLDTNSKYNPGPIVASLYISSFPVIGIGDNGKKDGQKEQTKIELIPGVGKAIFDPGKIEQIQGMRIRYPDGLSIDKEGCVDYEKVGDSEIKLKQSSFSIIDFEKNPQYRLPSCTFTADPDKLLTSGQDVSKKMFSAIIIYQYTVETKFPVKNGDEIETTNTGSSTGNGMTGAACPLVDSSDYPEINPDNIRSGAKENIKQYNEIIEKIAKEQGVCSALIRGFITWESSANANAIGAAGEIGLMQIMPSTGIESCKSTGISSSEDLKNPEKNIRCGTRYIKSMLERFNGNLVYAISGYNAGPGTVPDNIPSITKNEYVPNVIGLAKYFSRQQASSGSGSGSFSGTKFSRLPVDGPVLVTSCFGYRNRNGGEWHDGIDLDRDGTSMFVVAVADGTVYDLCEGNCAGFGNTIAIKHNDNLYTTYNHLQSIRVKKGQKVETGNIIALSGNTPNVDPHLDFKVYEKREDIWGSDTAVNPFCYLPLDKEHGVSSFTGTGCYDKQMLCSCKKLGQCN